MTAKGISFAEFAETNVESALTGQRKAVIDPRLSGGYSGATSRRERLQRERATLSASPAVVAESVPAWLSNIGTEAPVDNITSTGDIMDEFLENEDMMSLEVICMRWQGLDSSEIDALRKINPELADNLVLGDKHVSSFLSYRHKLAEKQNRKVQMKLNMKKRVGIEAVEEEEDDDDEDEDSAIPLTPKGRKTIVRMAPSPATSVEVSKADDEKGRESRKSMFQRKKSLSVNTKPPSLRLSRVGGTIVGQDDADRATRSEKRYSSSPNDEDRRGGSEASNYQPLTPKKKRYQSQ